ncbi:MAG: LamG domain-containing protein, partial [Actinobacteria bacterium]|nr:LamG domain-containing protein [Actinomycetota bacterium]
MTLTGLTAVGTTAAVAAPVTAPTPDLLDVDFTGVDAGGNPVDHSASARVATKIGDPVFASDAQLNRSLPSFNEAAGPGNSALPAGTQADAYTYSLGDAYAAGKIQDGFAFECSFRTNGSGALSAENEICGDKYSGGFGMYVSAGSMLLNATVYDGAYKVASAIIKPNTWYSAVASWDGGVLSLYLDGVLMSSTAVTKMVEPAASRQVMALGGSPSSATSLNFRGQETMSAARIWSAPLTAAQVAEHAASSEVTRAISAMTDTEDERVSAPSLPSGKAWPTGVPKANISDVNFAGGNAVDTVTGATATVARNTGSSSPTIGDDTEIKQQVARFDGTHGYAFTTD